MAEKKQYITRMQEGGKILISEDVIATIALQALCEIEGFAGLNNKPGRDIAELARKHWNKGIKISISSTNKLTVDCNVMVYYGYNVVDTAKEIQKKVASEIAAYAGVRIVHVNVNVCGIARK